MTRHRLKDKKMTLLTRTFPRKVENFFPGTVRTSRSTHPPALFENSDYARIKYVPKIIAGARAEVMEIRLWCQECFEDNWAWVNDSFYFKNDADATLFTLRWTK